MAGGIASELAAAGFDDAVEVGRGGSGVVYRCYQQSLGRSVAIKVLANDLDDSDRERFLREGYAMGKLSGHPNIVNILQVGVTEGGRPFIVMPYHSVGSLAERVRREGRIAWPEALRMGVKLCGALETAHRAGTLHRDIKPANVLFNDYGEPQLSDFGTARIAGGYKTVTGFFTGTLSYTAPEVLAGNPPTVAADIYSLGATIYALIAGGPPHERKADEDLIAHYLRITSTPVPDLRPHGIPTDVCAAIERAMSREPGERQVSVAEFGRELQLAQRHNGLTADPMALSEPGGELEPTGGTQALPLSGASAPGRTEKSAPGIPESSESVVAAPIVPKDAAPQLDPNMFAHTRSVSMGNVPWQVPPQIPPAPPSEPPPPVAPPPYQSQPGPGAGPQRRDQKRLLIIAGAIAGVLVLVIGSVFFFTSSSDKDGGGGQAAPPRPPVEMQPEWQPIADARIARGAVAATEADGTIWVFGGLGAGNRVSGGHEGYDPALDSWKGGADLPVPVQRASAVTWQDTPVVLGGWRTEGSNQKVATDKVWRVVNSRWVELPPLQQPRAAASAAVVGDLLVVTGGVDANGKLLNTTEIYDGTGWKLGAPLPTPRQLAASASDGKLVYVLGGSTGTSDLTAVEAYDPVADTWTTMPALAEPRSDFGVAVTDSRLVAVGGMSSGQVLMSVEALDLTTATWTALPDLATGRHGLAVAAVGKTVYAIGGSTSPADSQVTASAESLKLAPRKPQPAAEWRALPDAPTARLMAASTVLDDKIYIAGGMLGHAETLDTFESFEPKTGKWETLPPLPIPLNHAAAAAFRGEVVVLGGASDTVADASNKVFAYRDGKWEELPSMQHARAAPAAAVIDDKLVVVGGQDNKQLVTQTEVFDGESWTSGPDMPTPREHLAAVSDGVYMYTVGGRVLSADENLGAFERFDPVAGKWDKLDDMPTPRGSYGAALVDGRIVAVGGEEPTRVLPTVEMFDISTGKWTTQAPINTPVHGQVVAAVENTVYTIGGADRPTHEGPVAFVEALDFS
ncbi:protein kinase [Mycobacterium barrassiae]|uniref:serine/threonine-protein kinase n=1 Tax=Mycobacterium barrassiae TaxID=319709 RepID=UPI002265D3AF|nr:serine/threonine-protein kinase [Mycobacterium barrassiae]MCV7301062.1 protein kinase [Mycobacterium barrassiae]